MRIIISSPGRKTKDISLEVESYNTIGNVKETIERIKCIHRDQQRLFFHSERLKDNRTLADYDIQNESTLRLMLQLGGSKIYIKTLTGKWYKLIFVREDLRLIFVYSIKQIVEEKEGISFDKQRLYHADKLLDDDARSLVDYDIDTGFILHLVRIPDARSKAIRTGDEAEPAMISVKVDSKRAREDSSSTPPQRSTRLYGANESFWDEEDFGLARRRSQALISPYDINRFESIDDRTLIESVANNCVQTINVTADLEHRLQEYKDRLMQLTNEGAHVKELYKKLRQELEMERSTGSFFLQSEAGLHHMATLEKSAIDDFKKSGAFQELLNEHGVRVYDKAVKEFQSPEGYLRTLFS